MRWIGVIACSIVALQCAQKAMGIEPQSMFAANSVWMWWFPAIWWSLGAVGLLFKNAA